MKCGSGLACVSRAALVGIVAVAWAAANGSGERTVRTKPATTPGVDVTRLTKADEGRLVSYVKQSGKSPVAYVVEKFKSHDIVILGETHGNRDNLEFLEKLIPAAYRKAGVRCLATEFLRSRNNQRANKIVTAATYDHDAVMDLNRDYGWIWGYKEYMDLFKAVWELNRSLPAGAEKFRIVGLDIKEDPIDTLPGSKNRSEVMRALQRRDDVMAETFIREIGRKGTKVLLHTGFHHAFTRYRQPRVLNGKLVGLVAPRLGVLLAKTYGEKVFQVRWHSRSYAADDARGMGRPRQVLGGLVDRVMAANGNRPVGFDVEGSPFAKLRDGKSYYFAFEPKVVFADINQGYVFLKPVSEFRRCRWAVGFINESNYDKARKMASFRGWVKPGEYKTPKELDARFKAIFEPQLPQRRPGSKKEENADPDRAARALFQACGKSKDRPRVILH